MARASIPQAFWWRRLHSLTGLGLTLFLSFHLFTNVQAALPVGSDGRYFIASVNSIHNTPFLPLVELLLLALPILIHMLWGMYYIHSGAPNALPSDGTHPCLEEYARNRAYSWQRLTAWLLVVGLVIHVGHMRFYNAPLEVFKEYKPHYLTQLTYDEGLTTLAERLGVTLYTQEQITTFTPLAHTGPLALQAQQEREQRAFLEALRRLSPTEKERLALSPSFGVAELLMVRQAFRSPFWMLFYTLFVWAACFHGFNGLWTFCLTWGVVLSVEAQHMALRLCTALMGLFLFLGMATIYLTFWITLRS